MSSDNNVLVSFSAGGGLSVRGTDFNTLALGALMVWLLGWLLWHSLPVFVGLQPWLMEATSSGHKLNAFHVAVEQSRVERPPSISPAEFRARYGSQPAMIEVPLREVEGVTYGENGAFLQLDLRAKHWRHQQGSRALVLAKWSEEFFPYVMRTYAVALHDAQPAPAICLAYALPVDRATREAFLANARVRFRFLPSETVATRLEQNKTPPGFVASQAFMLGVTLEHVSLVDPDGVELAVALPRIPAGGSC